MKTLSKLAIFALPLFLAAPVMAEETAAAPAATDAAKPAPAKGKKAKKDPGSPEAPAADAAKAEGGEKKEGDAAKPAKKGKAKKAEGEKKEGEAKSSWLVAELGSLTSPARRRTPRWALVPSWGFVFSTPWTCGRIGTGRWLAAFFSVEVPGCTRTPSFCARLPCACFCLA